MPFTVDTDIPYGNACDVSVTEADGVAEIAFAADPHGGPECLWFCFRDTRAAAQGEPAEKLRLVLKHPNNMLGSDQPLHMRPLVRYEGAIGRGWTRGPSSICRTAAVASCGCSMPPRRPSTWPTATPTVCQRSRRCCVRRAAAGGPIPSA